MLGVALMIIGVILAFYIVFFCPPFFYLWGWIPIFNPLYLFKPWILLLAFALTVAGFLIVASRRK